VLVGTPTQLFPALRIIKAKLFDHLSGMRDSSTKWKKNTFRSGTVLLRGVIAALGTNDLDKFVALVGSFSCVPLAYIYPALLHYKGIRELRLVAVGDVLLMVAVVHYLHYTIRVDWISTEYNYHGKVAG
jgi:proton-coupled amino acid transporter